MFQTEHVCHLELDNRAKGPFGRITSYNVCYTKLLRRISPRIILGNKTVKVMLEVIQTYAGYGTPDTKLNITNVENVGDTRVQLHVKYSF